MPLAPFSLPKRPLVSVVTPTYNQADYCRELVESVMTQSYENLEHLVVNDGSTDATARLLEELTNAHHGRLRVFQQTNAGQSASVNRGIMEAQGDLILWINSDDLLTCTALEDGVEALRAHPECAAAYGNYQRINHAGVVLATARPQSGTLKSLLLADTTLFHCALLIRRAAFYAVGLLDASLYYAMDLEFLVRLAARHSLAYVDGRPWAQYRDHDATKTNASRLRAAGELVMVFDSMLARPEVRSATRTIRAKCRSRAYWSSAIYYASGGGIGMAVRQAATAFALDPLSFVLKPEFERHPRAIGVFRELQRRWRR